MVYALADQGSPPRARGRVGILGADLQLVGITPARAGKSGRPVDLAGALRDHPRACGEETAGPCYEAGGLGSPPRVRGRVNCTGWEMTDFGITPARAGKSIATSCKVVTYQDHPRACGEEAVTMLYALADEGSPPRVRGRATQIPHGIVVVGITPARAGKSEPGCSYA